MKKCKYILLVLILLVIFTGCSKKEGIWIDAIKSDDLDDVVSLGLKDLRISEKEILHIENIKDEKLMFFTSDNALGTASVIFKEGNWYWGRTGALNGFNSDSKLQYTDAGSKVKTLSGSEYFVVLGEIYNSNIEKITLDDDSVQGIIKKYKNKIFWFAILENNDQYKNIKAYDNKGKL